MLHRTDAWGFHNFKEGRLLSWHGTVGYRVKAGYREKHAELGNKAGANLEQGWDPGGGG